MRGSREGASRVGRRAEAGLEAVPLGLRHVCSTVLRSSTATGRCARCATPIVPPVKLEVLSENGMRFGRLALASFVLFLIAIPWNAFWHLWVLREANALVVSIRRAPSADVMLLSVLLTLLLTLLFTYGYARVARTGRVAEGLRYGVFFGLLTGVLVDLNQYVGYPIPGRVAFLWFVGGLLEFSLYGAVVTRFYPFSRTPRADV